MTGAEFERRRDAEITRLRRRLADIERRIGTTERAAQRRPEVVRVAAQALRLLERDRADVAAALRFNTDAQQRARTARDAIARSRASKDATRKEDRP